MRGSERITLAQSSRDARPLPQFGRSHHAGPDGVELHVPDRSDQMGVVHGARMEAALPQMPRPSVALVDEPRVSLVYGRQGLVEAADRLRHENEVGMIGHQTPRKHTNLRLPAAFPDQLDVAGVIALAEERLLPPVATLNDVVGDAWDDDTSDARHGVVDSIRPQADQEQNRIILRAVTGNGGWPQFNSGGPTYSANRLARVLRPAKPPYPHPPSSF